ncbi:MAG: hypothetical protein HY689_06315 [Chloroflexi bacterium]|nr:hypothetical protein [Chloroflexota bacterium]
MPRPGRYPAEVRERAVRLVQEHQQDSPSHTDLVRTAWEPALWVRQGPFDRLMHHAARGVPYLSARDTERLAQAGMATSVGSRGNSSDNALAESVHGRYRAGLGYPRPLARQGGSGMGHLGLQTRDGSFVRGYAG